jgi:hypothetical protein
MKRVSSSLSVQAHNVTVATADDICNRSMFLFVNSLAVGAAGGWALRALLRRVPLSSESLYPLAPPHPR